MELLKHVVVSGTIRCLTGVRIGGIKETIEIGAIDNPIIRNPIANHPYLPGSSLKGKMRSALELSLAKSGLALQERDLPKLTPREVYKNVPAGAASQRGLSYILASAVVVSFASYSDVGRLTTQGNLRVSYFGMLL